MRDKKKANPRVAKQEPTCIYNKYGDGGKKEEERKRHGDLIWNDEMTLAEYTLREHHCRGRKLNLPLD
jgi:hypothetical protein